MQEPIPMETLYRENILDHYKNPRNYGTLLPFTSKNKIYNPTCGDEIELFVFIDKHRINDVRFRGHGCALSMAAASMLTEKIKHLTIQEVSSLKADDVFTMLGVNVSGSRVRCATLALVCLQGGLDHESPHHS